MQHLDEGPNELAEKVMKEAQAWLGTPYQHQASSCGFGTDCLGLVRGIYRAVIGPEPEAAPPYSSSWAEAGQEDHLTRVGQLYFEPISFDHRQAGDVLAFRWRANIAPKHLGVLVQDNHMIHAHQGHKVCQVPLSAWWERRIAGVYRFTAQERK